MTDQIKQQADAIARKVLTAINKNLDDHLYRTIPGVVVANIIEIISNTSHLPELLALEAAVRADDRHGFHLSRSTLETLANLDVARKGTKL